MTIIVCAVLAAPIIFIVGCIYFRACEHREVAES